MNIPEVNRILSMYNIQVRRDVGRWYIASLTATDNGEILWGHLNEQGDAEQICEYVLKNVDRIRRFNGE